MPPPSEEADLVAKIIAGDQEAMVDLAERYRPLLIASIRKQGIPEQDCGDLVQEILSAAFSQIQRQLFRGDCSLGTWLATIARGKAIDRQKSASQRAQRLTDSGETALRAARSEAIVSGNQDLQLAVRQTLSLLGPQERAILKLKDMEGFTVKEIVAISGLPEEHVYHILEKARDKFRRIFSGESTSSPRLIG